MPTPTTARRVGLIVGALIGGVLGLVELFTGAIGSFITSNPAVAVGILAAGSIGGWIEGPRAIRARGPVAWLVVVGRLALLALLIGDVAVVGTGLALTTIGATNDPLTIVAVGPLYLVLGLIVVGPFVLPFTLGAAAVWAAVMWRLPRPSSSASGAVA